MLIGCSGETEDTFIADLSVGLSTVSCQFQTLLVINIKYLLENLMNYYVVTGTNQDRCALQIRASCKIQPGNPLIPYFLKRIRYISFLWWKFELWFSFWELKRNSVLKLCTQEPTSDTQWSHTREASPLEPRSSVILLSSPGLFLNLLLRLIILSVLSFVELDQTVENETFWT